VTTACLNLVGKRPVESDVLKSSAMNGASSPLHCLPSHVGAVSVLKYTSKTKWLTADFNLNFNTNTSGVDAVRLEIN